MHETLATMITSRRDSSGDHVGMSGDHGEAVVRQVPGLGERAQRGIVRERIFRQQRLVACGPRDPAGKGGAQRPIEPEIVGRLQDRGAAGLGSPHELGPKRPHVEHRRARGKAGCAVDDVGTFVIDHGIRAQMGGSVAGRRAARTSLARVTKDGSR
jgi:hypothetical protein